MKPININTLILHIGSHKTGSTYLQKVFKDHRLLLAEKSLLYPITGCGILFGHHEIFNAIRTKNNKIDSLMQQLADEHANNYNTIFLSSENFEYLAPDEINELMSYFDYNEIKIIYFYRAWTPLCYAMWQEEIKHGSTTEYESYCLKHIAYPLMSNLLNYSRIMDNYEKIVGHENLLIASYDSIIKIDLVDFLFSIIGLENAQVEGRGERVNSSFDPFLVETIRVMNEFARNHNFKPSYLPKHMYINKAKSGKDGLVRDERIREAMSNYLTKSHDLTQTLAFRYIYGMFFEKYSSCFVDGTNDLKEFLKKTYRTPYYVSSGYLLNNRAVNDLYSAWLEIEDDIEKKIRSI